MAPVDPMPPSADSSSENELAPPRSSRSPPLSVKLKRKPSSPLGGVQRKPGFKVTRGGRSYTRQGDDSSTRDEQDDLAVARALLHKRVTIGGLTVSTELNGKGGIARLVDGETERIHVQLDGDLGTAALPLHNTTTSVYEARASFGEPEPASHDVSIYSTYRQRQCRCRMPDPPTLWHPPKQTETDPSAPPCFVPTAPADEPFLTVDGTIAIESSLYCYIRTNPAHTGEFPPGMSNDAKHAQVRTKVSRCLTPARSGSNPQRAVFMFGDSHMGAIAKAMMVALDGAASVVWTATGGGCGYLGIGVMANEFECQFCRCRSCNCQTMASDRDVWMAEDCWGSGQLVPLCYTFNKVIDETLESQLQPCDIVVVHHARVKWGDRVNGPVYNAQLAKMRALQALVTRKGAKLVLIGDGVELPEFGSHCVASRFAPNAAERCAHSRAGQIYPDHVGYEDLARSDNTFFFNIIDLMCTDGRARCDANVPGTTTLAYHDKDHLTSAGALYLWPYICAFFQEHGLLGFEE